MQKQLLRTSFSLLIVGFSALAANAQGAMCNCISAWQQGVASANCPKKDSLHRFDRSNDSYILFQSKDNGAEGKLQEIASAITACTGKSHKVQKAYDPVQMSDVYTYLPTTDSGVRLELKVKFHNNESAVLLHVLQPAAIPGGDAAFRAATQQLINDRTASLKRKAPFAAPARGWATLYPTASYAGTDTITERGGIRVLHNYTWRADDADGQALHQGLLKILKSMPVIAANALAYNDEIPGKSMSAGFHLMPPNPPMGFEVSYQPQTASRVVTLRVIEFGVKK